MEEFLDHIPLSEEEALGLFSDGDYPAFIEKMEIKVSKAGNKCFVATITLSDPVKSQKRTITKWFGLPHILKHAYDATNQSDKYLSNKLSTKDLEGKRLIARVKVLEGNAQYPQPKNEIYDFVVNPNASQKSQVIPEPEITFNDELPF